MLFDNKKHCTNAIFILMFGRECFREHKWVLRAFTLC